LEGSRVGSPVDHFLTVGGNYAADVGWRRIGGESLMKAGNREKNCEQECQESVISHKRALVVSHINGMAGKN
jgi:hypothetical protein